MQSGSARDSVEKMRDAKTKHFTEPRMRHKKSNGLGIAPWEPQTITWNRKASSESSAGHPTSSRHSSTRSYKSGPLAPSGRRRRSTTTFLTTGRTHVSLSTTGRGQREKRGLGKAWGARSERSSVGHWSAGRSPAEGERLREKCFQKDNKICY